MTNFRICQEHFTIRRGEFHQDSLVIIMFLTSPLSIQSREGTQQIGDVSIQQFTLLEKHSLG